MHPHRAPSAKPARLLPIAPHPGACWALLLCTSALAGSAGFVNFETPQVHPVDLTPSGALLLVVNTADNRLEIFESGGLGLAHAGAVQVGLEPVAVRARSETEAWVVNHLSDSISIVDLPTRRVRRTIATGDEPCDVVFAGSPQRAFISVSQLNRLLVLDAENPTAPGTVVSIAGEDPRALAVSADGSRVLAAIFESGNHSTVLARGAVSAPTGPYGGENPPPNDGDSFSPPKASELPDAPVVAHIVRKEPDGTWRDDNGADWSEFVNWDAHDHDVALVDVSSLATSYVGGMMANVAGIATGPGGTAMVVGTQLTNHIRFEPNLNGVFVRSEAATFDSAGATAGPAVDLNPHLDYSTSNIGIAMRELSIGDPRGVVFHPSGSKAYVTGMGSGNVVVTDASGGRSGLVAVGQGPTGMAIDAAGTRLYVLNRFDATVSTIDTASDTELSRTAFFDPTPEVVRAGRPFLYDTHMTSGLGQASCASCHVDGRTDHLAWDLGDPAGEVIPFDGDCIAPDGCVDWHPMRGPMVTQTLFGIAGNEPFHWRGEKSGLEEFNVAYTHLQGADAEISDSDMQTLKDFAATLTFPPNPNRNLDNSLKTNLPVFAGNGSPVNGESIFLSVPTLPGPNALCVDCHALPAGTSNVIGQPLGPEPQNRKIAYLRNMYEKVGASHQSQENPRGFGLHHDGAQFTIAEVLAPGFTFPPGPAGQQQRRDVEAFMLSFDTGTHAAVGAQTTASNGGGAGDDPALINQFLSLAAGGGVELVVKGRVSGLPRGWHNQGGLFQSDRATEAATPDELLALADNGSELTYTLVPSGTGVRIGIDRDLDGWYDRDEMDAGSDPANPGSTPANACPADFDGSGSVDGADLGALLAQWGGAGAADLTGDGVVDGADLGAMLAAWGACPAR